MSYSDFTLESVGRILGITAHAADLFPGLQPLAAPPWLLELLARGAQGIKLSLISEKARISQAGQARQRRDGSLEPS
jgi:hypothetical protein